MSRQSSFLCVALVLISLGAGGSSRLSAQWPAQVTPGARVQVRLPEKQYQLTGPRGQFIRGRVNSLSNDTLYLAVTDSLGPLAIPRSFIQRMEISRGVPSRGLSALERGLLTGAALALTFWAVEEIDGHNDSGDAALVGGGIGLALGSISGALWPKERWKRVKSGF